MRLSPPNPPTSRSDCVLTQSQETLWPLRAALLWGNTHARWAGVQRPTSPHDAPATYQPKITKKHTHTLLFNYWYCIDLDVFAGTKKAQFKSWPLNLECLTSWTWSGLQKSWCHGDAGKPASWTTFFSFTHSLTLPAFFSSYFFLRGSHVALRPAVTLGTLVFQRRKVFLSLSMKTLPHTSGDGEEFVHVWPDSPAFLHPPSRRSMQPDHPNASRFWRTKTPFCCRQPQPSSESKILFSDWHKCEENMVKLIFITHAKIVIFWVTPKFSPVW